MAIAVKMAASLGGFYRSLWALPIQRDVVLAPNALVFMWTACYSDGKTGEETYTNEPNISVIKKRIEDYSDTFVRLGANYSASCDLSAGTMNSIITGIFDEGKTFEQARDSVGSGSQLYDYNHPQEAGKKVKFNYTKDIPNGNSPYSVTSGVIAGNMSAKAGDILNDFVPPTPDPNRNLPRETGKGYGAANYYEYLLVTYPADGSGGVATVRVEFTKRSGNSFTDFQVPAGGRYTLNVNSFTNAEDVSMKVISDKPVVAERAMYFDSSGRTGGSDKLGIRQLSSTWYLAEGYTAEQFDEWILIQNPQASAVGTTVTLMRDDGYQKDFGYQIPANSRFTLHVDNLPGFENANVSAKITASAPVAVERAMYFDYHGIKGGHDERGVASPGDEWYLAEGYTAEQFDTFVLLANPEDVAANVRIEFQKEGGGVVPLTVNVGPHSRYTVKVDNVPGMDSTSFSTKVTSTGADILVERSMYFNYRGQDDGSVAAALPSASKDFYLAEGCTAYGFDSYLLLQNPNAAAVEVAVTFNPDPSQGAPFTKKYVVGAHSRYTVNVGLDTGFSGSLGFKVHCESPIMVERAMYFTYQNGSANGGVINGGHCATGATSPSTVWYFAEGYTGN